MAPPRPTIAPHVGVPKVSFRKIQPTGKEYDGVDDKIAQQYGYNEVNVSFERPEHYIRYVDPVESELLTQVEYDMDEQDDEWLTAINNERYKDQSERVSAETFEIIIDRLEKEWFDLMKRVPKPEQALPSEDSTCAVCDDGEGENSNAIVFCDGCNLAVHQDCYGVPYIPEGQWLCRKCTVAPESRVECILCPNEGGAFKQTSNGKWAHLLCAIWVPECILGNPTFMEPIENSDKIPKQRWKLVCSICKVKQGACIQCNKNTCVTAFHVSCARRHKLLSPMKSHGENELQAFCEKHLPSEMRVNRIVPSSPSVPPTPTSPVRSPKKASRAQVQPTGPPLVPSIIVDKIMQYTSRITFRKKLPFLLAVCRYWSLKREARRGAPLLKRLHLEPWAPSTATKLQTDDDKLKYLDNLTRLRRDLERVLALADLVRQREGEKQTQAQTVESLITTYLLPFDAELRKVYESVVALDRSGYFMNPVSRIEVPEYYSIIKQPMHWLGIYAKIEQHEYLDSQAFVDDVCLVLDNAIQYNKKETPFHKTAVRIKNNVRPILEQFQQTIKEKAAVWANVELAGDEAQIKEPAADENRLEAAQEGTEGMAATVVSNGHSTNQDQAKDPNGETDLALPETPVRLANGETTANPEDEVIPGTPTPEPAPDDQVQALPAELDPGSVSPVATESQHAPPQIGDMEPDISLLHILQDQTSVSEDFPYILSADPLTSFFTYEKAIPKPPPPPPLPPAKQPRKNKKKHTVGDAANSKALARGASGTPHHTHPRLVLKVREPTQATENAELTASNVEADTSSALPTSKSGKRKRQDSESWAQLVKDVNSPIRNWLGITPWFNENKAPYFSTSYQNKRDRCPDTVERRESKRVRMSSSIAGDVQSPTMMLLSRQSSQLPTMHTEAEDAVDVVPMRDGTPPTAPPTESTSSNINLVVSHNLQPHKSESADPSPVDEAPGHLRPPNAHKKNDASSDLSELSDTDERKTKFLAKANVSHTSSGIHKDEHGEPTHYEAGTLVWARQAGFPWYPAVVYEPPDEVIPPKILAHEHEIHRKLKYTGRLYLVQFYDKQRTWTWVPLSRLTMLGEDKEIDQKYLHPTGKHASSKKDVQTAYNMALQEMETVEESGQAEISQPA